MCRCVYWPSSSVSRKRICLNKVESNETPAGDPWYSPKDFKSLLLLDVVWWQKYTATAVLSNRLHLRTPFSFYYVLHLLCYISVECLLWSNNFCGDLLSSIDIWAMLSTDFLCVLYNWSLQCSSVNTVLTDLSLYSRGLGRPRGILEFSFSAHFRSAGSTNTCHLRKKHVQIEPFVFWRGLKKGRN